MSRTHSKQPSDPPRQAPSDASSDEPREVTSPAPGPAPRATRSDPARDAPCEAPRDATADGPGEAHVARGGAPGGRGESNRRTGALGEALAARYLEDLGWQIVERNWRPGSGRRGELDIVALQPAEDGGPDHVVAVEVKTRTSLRAGPPAAAVTGRKLTTLRALAAAWAGAHEAHGHALRLDVVSVLLRTDAPAQIRHHRGVGL